MKQSLKSTFFDFLLDEDSVMLVNICTVSYVMIAVNNCFLQIQRKYFFDTHAHQMF